MRFVAPLVGAWIEIVIGTALRSDSPSLPLWERGLKYDLSFPHRRGAGVAPLVGAWIEITIRNREEEA